jgi:hypothetical protein
MEKMTQIRCILNRNFFPDNQTFIISLVGSQECRRIWFLFSTFISSLWPG